jgi:hypothetical protein
LGRFHGSGGWRRWRCGECLLWSSSVQPTSIGSSARGPAPRTRWCADR